MSQWQSCVATATVTDRHSYSHRHTATCTHLRLHAPLQMHLKRPMVNSACVCTCAHVHTHKTTKMARIRTFMDGRIAKNTQTKAKHCCIQHLMVGTQQGRGAHGGDLQSHCLTSLRLPVAAQPCQLQAQGARSMAMGEYMSREQEAANVYDECMKHTAMGGHMSRIVRGTCL